MKWILSSGIPVTNGITWLSRFSVVNISFIGFVIAESFVSSYMATKKQTTPPSWLIWMIHLSLCHLYVDAYASSISTGKYVPPDFASEGDKEDVPASMEIEMRDKTGLTGSIGSSSEGTDGEERERRRQRHRQQLMKMSWERGSRALDRLSRVLVPIVYVIVLAALFAEI